MAQFLFDVPPATSLPIAGSDQRFPVRRVYCVGRNYADHAREMGADPNREPPFFFSKPADALVSVPPQGVDLRYPLRTRELHHEVELVVALKGGGVNLSLEQAAGAIAGYAVGLDMTLRDIQGAAKAAGKPWDLGKGFDQSGPVGPLHLDSTVKARGSVQLMKNGVPVQQGNIDQMMWAVDEVIAELSKNVELKAGDLIFTGTPAGVGPVVAGDVLTAQVEGLTPIEVRYTAR